MNDLNGDVVKFFRVIQDPESCQELQRWLSYTPYSRQIYEETFTREPRSPVEQAGYLAVRSMQSHGFWLTEKCGWKKDVYGREAAYAGMPCERNMYYDRRRKFYWLLDKRKKQ